MRKKGMKKKNWKKAGNITIGIIIIFVFIVAILIITDFPLVNMIKEKTGKAEKPKYDIEQTVTYEMFMNRAEEILSKADVTKVVNDLYSGTEEEVYYLLFLLNHDSLAENAVKRLMDEKVIMNSAYDCGQGIGALSALVNSYDLNQRFGIETDGYMSMRDFCLGEANADFCNYLLEIPESEQAFLEYYNYVVNDGDLTNYTYDGEGSVAGLKFRELPTESKVLIESLAYYIEQVCMNEADGYESYEEELRKVFILNDDSVFNSLKHSKYNEWFASGVTQFLEKHFD